MWKDLKGEIADLFNGGVFSLADVNPETGSMGIAHGPHLRTSVINTKVPTDRHYLDPTQRRRQAKENKKAWRRRTGYYAKRYARRKAEHYEALGQVWRKASLKYQAKTYAEMTAPERAERNRKKREQRDPERRKLEQRLYFASLTPVEKAARQARQNELRRAKREQPRASV